MKLNKVISINHVDMGQCMCPVNCTKKYENNKEVVFSAQKAYTNPTLKEVVGINHVDMGQCMCPVNCTKKYENNKEIVSTAQKVYKKTFKKAA